MGRLEFSVVDGKHIRVAHLQNAIQQLLNVDDLDAPSRDENGSITNGYYGYTDTANFSLSDRIRIGQVLAWLWRRKISRTFRSSAR
jgi:hypothetical protein